MLNQKQFKIHSSVQQKHISQPPIDYQENNKTKLEKILREILPEIRSESSQEKLIQKNYSCEPGKIQDLIDIETNMDFELEKQQVNQVGLCDKRRKLYQQVFNELIRQITINCQERGILLSKVRNEFENQIIGYVNLYAANVKFTQWQYDRGQIQKIKNEQQRNSLQEEIKNLQQDLERIKIDLQRKKETQETDLDTIQNENQELLEQLTKENEQLRKELYEKMKME